MRAYTHLLNARDTPSTSCVRSIVVQYTASVFISTEFARHTKKTHMYKRHFFFNFLTFIDLGCLYSLGPCGGKSGGGCVEPLPDNPFHNLDTHTHTHTHTHTLMYTPIIRFTAYVRVCIQVGTHVCVYMSCAEEDACHTRRRTHVCIQVGTHVCIHVCASAHAPVYACVRARTRMQVVVGAFEYANTYTHTCIRACIHVYA